MALDYKWPIALLIIVIFLALWILGVWSIFLWKKSTGVKKIMYIIGGIITLLFALAMTIIFIISIF